MSGDQIFYMIISMPVIINTFILFILNRKRATLDVNKPDDAKRAKALRTIMMVLSMETMVVIAIFFIYVKPILTAGH